MAQATKPIPDGYHTLTPYLIVKGGVKAIEFYKQALGAVELFRMPGPDGKSIGHAEIKIGDSIVMLSEENPAWGNKSPQTLGGVASSLMVYVKDVDTAFKRAVAAGATVIRPVADQFYGDRSGCISDPFGHQWTISTHTEDLTPEELKVRGAEAMKKMCAQASSSKPQPQPQPA